MRIQLTLTLITFFLVVGTLLYGWVYLDSINGRYLSIIKAPKDTEQVVAKLEAKVAILEGELDMLNSQLALLQPNTPILVEQEEIVLPTPDKIDLFVDQKCFSNPNDLNECVVLNKTTLDTGVDVLIKPVLEISREGLNQIVFEFYENQNLITKLKITTRQLFVPDEPIATLVYINKNDLTLKARHGTDQIDAVFTYDGIDWIDYSRYTFLEGDN